MFIDQNEAMVAKQAQVITDLREEMRRKEIGYKAELQGLLDTNAKLGASIKENQKAGRFYLQLQRAILDNPILQSEWERFCSFLKLADFDEYKKKSEEPGPAEAADETETPEFLSLPNKWVNYKPPYLRNIR